MGKISQQKSREGAGTGVKILLLAAVIGPDGGLVVN